MRLSEADRRSGPLRHPARCGQNGHRRLKEQPLPPTEKQPTPPPEDESLQFTQEEEAAFRAVRELHETPLLSFGTESRFDSADKLFQWLQDSPLSEPQWAFRGHEKTGWSLEPSIERLRKQHNHLRKDAETYILRAFKRRAHHYGGVLPEEKDELEWMALMRHHGAPTRLLDWTRSPYVAAFFATAEATPGEPSAIWAIDIRTVTREAAKILEEAGAIDNHSNFSFSNPGTFNVVFMRDIYPLTRDASAMRDTDPAIVAPVQPFRTNERVTSQQGLFLCPNSLLHGFEFGLKHVLKSDQKRAEEGRSLDFFPFLCRLYKIVIGPDARAGVLRELHRMNINYATLFPGLDGFARSLGTTVTIAPKKSKRDGGGDVDFSI